LFLKATEKPVPVKNFLDNKRREPRHKKPVRSQKIDLFAVGFDRGIYHRAWNGASWTNWVSMGCDSIGIDLKEARGNPRLFFFRALFQAGSFGRPSGFPFRIGVAGIQNCMFMTQSHRPHRKAGT
jgi:hypothetical protein